MARFIMAGRLQAFSFLILFSVLAFFMPLLSLFSNATIALVTLRRGWQSGLALTVTGVIALSLLTFILEKNIYGGFFLGLIQWLPIVLLASILYQSVSWKLTLESVLILAAVGVLGFHAIVPDTITFWTSILEKSVKPLLEASNNPELNAEEWISNVSQWMTAMAAAFTCIIWSLSLFLARHWQAQLYNPNGFGEEFRAIRLGKIAAGVVLALILLSVLTRHQIAIELMMCGIAVFLFQGISLVHDAVKSLKLHPAILVLFYVLLLFILPVHIALLVTAFGMIDCFADFRAKLIKQ